MLMCNVIKAVGTILGLGGGGKKNIAQNFF